MRTGASATTDDGPPTALRRGIAAARRTPFTTVVAALVVIASVGDGVIDVRRGIVDGLGPASRPFWIVQLGGAVLGGLFALAVTVAAVVVLLGAAERLMGWRRSLLAFVSTTVVGAAVTAVAVAVLDGFGVAPAFLARLAGFDPWSAVVGSVAAASAFAGALWRRRIRVVALAVSATLLLYAGRSSDLSLAIAALAGVGLGELLRRGPRRPGWQRSSHRESRVLLSAVVLAYALGPVVGLVSRSRVGLLTPVVRVLAGGGTSGGSACRVGDVTDVCARSLAGFHLHGPGAFVLGVAPLVALVVGGVGILRGSRVALWSVVVVDVVTGVAAATFYGIVPLSAVEAVDGRRASDGLAITISIVASVLVPLATAVVLVVRRGDFRVRTSRARVRQLVVATTATALALAVGVALVAVIVGVRSVDPIRMGLAVLGPLTPESVQDAAQHGHPALRIAVALVGPIEWFVLAAVLARAIRPVPDVGPTAELDPVRRARSLVHLGGDGFAWMTTWPGNELWFSRDGRAGIAYRRSGRVAVTLGGPFGEPDAVDDAWEEFATHCDDLGWTASFYAVDPAAVESLRRRGWSLLPVASDAVLDVASWSLSGKRRQDVRTAVNRAHRDGTRAVWGTWSDLTPARVRQIVEISEEWVAERDLPEMGFTLGGIDEMRDPEVRVLLAEDPTGRVLAVTSWLPAYQEGRPTGWTLDVMRRRRDAPNGVMEFLVNDVVERARSAGLAQVGLSAAPLAGVEASGGGVSSVLELVGEVLEPVYGFRSLLRFKAKFGPTMRPLVMSYPDPVALPAIGVAIARAYLPGLRVAQVASLVQRH